MSIFKLKQYMSNLNLKSKEERTFDAIVIGSGISGGWAAKELTEKGLKTLVLERGRDIKHGEYPTANSDPWDFKYRGLLTREEKARQFKQHRTGYTTRPTHNFYFVDDIDHPYNEDKRFDWMRGYHVGGRSLMWGRHSYRWSEMDFEANAKDGFGVDWPIRYKDIEPWYDYVERFVGISGMKENLAQCPDNNYQPAMGLNCVEEHTRQKIAENFGGRVMTQGRIAHLTAPNPDIHKGRGSCQYRNRCMRGCPYGAYFSSNSSTLPAAYATGNLTMRPFSIVTEIMYDKDAKKATGVKIIDTNTNEEVEFYSKIVFSCASAVGVDEAGGRARILTDLGEAD
ncbi:MAG: GMC family oxidoreductase [Pseudomonadota bacterium]